MAEAWEDDGAWGSAARVPTDTWFPVNTATGEWSLPGTPSTLASSAGMPDAGASPVWGATPDQAPLAIGQVAGTMAPPMTAPASMGRVARADAQGLLAPQPSVWESIARGIGMASPTGRAYLQASDQSQQQQLTNRLAQRRQQLLEEQETRQATQTSLETLRKISEMPNKTMRNLMFDRYVADMSSSGQALPADMVEAFKKSSLDEGKQMATMLTPMFEAAGIDPTTASQILQEGGDPKRLLEMIDMGLKAKKQKADEAEEARLTQSRSTLFGASGGAGTTTAAPPAPTPTETTGAITPTTTTAPQAPAGRLQAPPDIEEAIAEAHRLYPQVRPELIRATMMQESSFSKDAKGSAGEIGLMQLKPGTAKDMGVDPGDWRQNVIGGTKYLAQHLTTYGGNEAKALAAYNQGPGNVPKEGDIPAKGQAYAQQVLGRTTGGQPATGGTPAARDMVAGPGAPSQDQAQVTRLNQQIAAMDQFLAANIGSGRERTKGMVNEVQQERTRLIQEREKLLETPRAYAREKALQPLKLAQQRAGAEVQIEADMNKPIGNEAAKELGISPRTKWKDVPADLMPKKDPSPPERQAFSDMRASVAGIDRLTAALDKPEIARMVGTLWSEPEASVARKLGAYLATLSPEQRQFAATLAGEVMEIRHRLAGANQTPSETAAMAPMLPTPDDTDPATLRAKLTALREAMTRRHDAKREDLEGMGFRVPATLTGPGRTPPETPAGKDLLKDMQSGNKQP